MVAAKDGEKAWHGVAAGCVAGASGVLIGHGFDTAKVRAQAGEVVELELRSLFRGILPPLVTTGMMRSFYFGVYETIRPPVAGAWDWSDDALPTVFVAGMATGLITAPVTAPVQRLKLVQQLSSGQYASTRDAAMKLVRAEGTRGLFRGLGVHCALETLGSGCYLLAYAAAKHRLRDIFGASEGGAREPLAMRVLCGMSAGVVGWLSIYPLDVLRSRIMSAPPEAIDAAAPNGLRRAPESLYSMVTRAAHATYAAGGVRGFYRGLSFTLLRAAPVAGVLLPTYDACKAFLARRQGVVWG